MKENGKLTQSEAGKLGAIASKEINAQKYKERVDDYNANPKLCQYCLKPIHYSNRDGKFCSRSCFGYDHNKYVTKTIIEKQCEFCPNKFSVTYETRNNKCCDLCAQNKAFRLTAKNATDITELHSDRTRKIYLIEKFGSFCFICKNTEWNNKPIPIELDHIDGNSENNIEENLRLLCPNCHAQTDTYKNKNRGNGRHSRTKRYKDGKSY